MDTATIATILGTGIGVAGFIYSYLRNFKADMDFRFDRMDRRFEASDQRYRELEIKMDQRITEANKRMDGVYNILLKRTE